MWVAAQKKCSIGWCRAGVGDTVCFFLVGLGGLGQLAVVTRKRVHWWKVCCLVSPLMDQSSAQNPVSCLKPVVCTCSTVCIQSAQTCLCACSNVQSEASPATVSTKLMKSEFLWMRTLLGFLVLKDLGHVVKRDCLRRTWYICSLMSRSFGLTPVRLQCVLLLAPESGSHVWSSCENPGSLWYVSL